MFNVYCYCQHEKRGKIDLSAQFNALKTLTDYRIAIKLIRLCQSKVNANQKDAISSSIAHGLLFSSFKWQQETIIQTKCCHLRFAEMNEKYFSP